MTTTPPRLALHVGPHKTASSYIQANFHAATDALKQRGWLYPDVGTEGQMAHHHLAHNANLYLEEQAPHKQELKALGETARSNGQNIVLSAEGFCRWQPANFAGLARILGFDTYDLIYVIRDPLDLFSSLWAEEVKQGRSMGFADRFAREFANPTGSRILNPVHDLNPFVARKNVRVHAVPYDILKKREIDIFEHIATDILGLDGFVAQHVKPVNVKYSIELTEFLRLMTLMHACGEPHIGSELRLLFTSLISKQEQADLRQLVLDHAMHARRVIQVPGNAVYRTMIQRALKNKLKDVWSLDLDEDEALFSDDMRRFIYYDDYLLSKVDAVREAAEDVLQRLGKHFGSSG